MSFSVWQRGEDIAKLRLLAWRVWLGHPTVVLQSSHPEGSEPGLGLRELMPYILLISMVERLPILVEEGPRIALFGIQWRAGIIIIEHLLT
jgi:hypothetical protein